MTEQLKVKIELQLLPIANVRQIQKLLCVCMGNTIGPKVWRASKNEGVLEI